MVRSYASGNIHFVCVSEAGHRALWARSIRAGLSYCKILEFVIALVAAGVWGHIPLARFPEFGNSCIADVEAALRRNPGYSLALCGHSLGAGIAALLSLLWQRRFPSAGVAVHAFAYAAPCVVDLRTAREAAHCVTTVVLGTYLT